MIDTGQRNITLGIVKFVSEISMLKSKILSSATAHARCKYAQKLFH